MTDQIKELIEKINQEGVAAAQQKAAEIESLAKLKAESTVKNAQLEAQRILSDAQDKAVRLEQSTKDALVQASRDLMLSLKKEILSVLERLAAAEASAVLGPEELKNMILELVKQSAGQPNTDVVITLNKADIDKLNADFIGRLKQQLQKGVVLKSSQDISAGFLISFDSGKSHFDFTDKALAEYLGVFLRPQLAQILDAK